MEDYLNLSRRDNKLTKGKGIKRTNILFTQVKRF